MSTPGPADRANRDADAAPPPTDATVTEKPGATEQARTRAALDAAVAALGGSPREGQIEMARRVTRTITSGGHLLVQAGTGTGKSLAYLVPAMVHAVEAGERTVVSTATLALQRQVLTKDAPLAADAVERTTGVRPSVALLKGWQNYLCRHRLAGGYPDDDADTLFSAAAAAPRARIGEGAEQTLGEQVVRLRQWAEQTDTGDRDDLVPGVSDRAWAQASVTAAECLAPAAPCTTSASPCAPAPPPRRPTWWSPTTPCSALPSPATPACCPSTRYW
nr:DEAD/DEAH box helicase [Actinomyces ruminis]